MQNSGPNQAKEGEPKKSTFEETIGHTPLNKLLTTRDILEDQADAPMSQAEVIDACARQKREFLKYWREQDLNRVVSGGRVDRDFVELMAIKMAGGDWTDLAFIEQTIRELGAIKDPGFGDHLSFLDKEPEQG